MPASPLHPSPLYPCSDCAALCLRQSEAQQYAVPPDPSAVDIARACLKVLSEDERVELFEEFCTYCGANDPKCDCMRDE